MKKDHFNLFVVLWAILSIFLVALILFFVLRIDKSNKNIEQLRKSIEQLQQDRPKDGADGHTPSYNELLALIAPLIPPPTPGANGSNGLNGTNGMNGSNGTDGTNAEPCTTYTDENNDSYIACPDGTQTLIPQPDQPRQIELCSTDTIPLGWRYVGTINCNEIGG